MQILNYNRLLEQLQQAFDGIINRQRKPTSISKTLKATYSQS